MKFHFGKKHKVVFLFDIPPCKYKRVLALFDTKVYYSLVREIDDALS